jgi:hypothetical protein
MGDWLKLSSSLPQITRLIQVTNIVNSKTGRKIDLETHAIEHPTADRYQHKSWFGKLLQAIVTAFEPRQEPIFWKKRVRAASSKKNRNGNVYWQGYDPVSNRSLEFGSDDEARHWLDRPQLFR